MREFKLTRDEALEKIKEKAADRGGDADVTQWNRKARGGTEVRRHSHEAERATVGFRVGDGCLTRASANRTLRDSAVTWMPPPGGYGSGRRYDATELVEECHTFPASWMLQNNYFDLGVGREYHSITWRNYCNEPLYTLTAVLERVAPYQMRLYLGITRQVVYLHSTDCRFGGQRWWFNCPECGRRCAKLYFRRHSLFLCRRCHDLRHSCATLLFAAGENAKVVSERLGHSSTAFTQDTYVHVLPSMQRAATSRLEGILGKR
jgi:hypothetical protein